MRVSFVMELVLGLAMGFGLARYRLSDPFLSGEVGKLSWVDWSEVAIDGTLAGPVLVGGLMVFAERLRGKSPSAWGPGRWAWAALAAYFLFYVLDNATHTVRVRLFFAGEGSGETLFQDLSQRFRNANPAFFRTAVSWLLVSLGLVGWAAPSSQPPRLDAREWAGRVLVIVMVASAAGLEIFHWLGYCPESMGCVVRCRRF